MSAPKLTKKQLAFRAAYYAELERLKATWTPKGAGGQWSGQQISLARSVAWTKASEVMNA
jgi:predicted alternative tryptophan synthase beta-subunit